MKRHNKNQTHELYKNWLAGKSKKEFALENDIAKLSSLNWIQKFQKQGLRPPSPAREARFSSPATCDGFLRREKQAVARTNYPSGASVYIFGVPGPAFLKTLIS